MLWLMDWALKATIRLFMEILWRLDWFVSNVFQQEKIDSNFSQSLLYQYFVFQSKKKKALNTDFINIHKYIKEITIYNLIYFGVSLSILFAAPF
jgi:hypothetical protein